MRCPDAIADETGRLRALADYGLDAETGLPSLDPVVEIALRMFDVPAAAVNIIGSETVFLAASVGVGACDMRRSVSFCAHAITQDEVMVIEDAALDPRFHDNPLVLANQIRFYAGVPLRSPEGHALGAHCIIDSTPHGQFLPEDRARLRDLARLASDQLELRRLEVARDFGPSRFASSAATSPNAVICFDAERKITAWNDAAADLFGYEAVEIRGSALDRLMPDDEVGRVRAAVEGVLTGEAEPTRDPTAFIGVRRDGSRFPAELHWSKWQERGRPHFGAIVQNVADRRRQEEALYHLANFDSLTGLPNRNYLYERAEQALRPGDDAKPALIMLDLDGFKDVNDTMGHVTGDMILVEVARRLVDRAGPSDIVARIGGDEFAILLAGFEDPLRVSRLADDMIDAVSGPIVVDNQEVRIAASCGLALAPLHGDRVEDLIASADLALFQAKTRGRGHSFLYVPALRSDAIARRMYDAELHRAVERRELVFFYQPQLRLADGALTGAEALMRWQHPIRGLLQPAAFLPALEAGTLAISAGLQALEAACTQAACWRMVIPDFRMSVNLFAAQFNAGDLPDIVADLLARHGLPPEALELEITENIALSKEDRVLPQLRAIRAMGVALAFDDFGTGYASLNMLKSFPISHIKIDKSFTQAVQRSSEDRAIIASLVDLAGKIGLDVIAEGVETRDQCAFLQEIGCGEGQGFLFGKPVPAPLFAEKFGLAQDHARRGLG